MPVLSMLWRLTRRTLSVRSAKQHENFQASLSHALLQKGEGSKTNLIKENHKGVPSTLKSFNIHMCIKSHHKDFICYFHTRHSVFIESSFSLFLGMQKHVTYRTQKVNIKGKLTMKIDCHAFKNSEIIGLIQ